MRRATIVVAGVVAAGVSACGGAHVATPGVVRVAATGPGAAPSPPPAGAPVAATTAAAGSAPGAAQTPLAAGTTGAVPAAAPVRVRPLVVTPIASPASAWQPVALVNGHQAAWVAQRGGVTLLRFDQRRTALHLHSGSAYPGGSGWTYGDQIGPGELHQVIAGFNGGFKFNVPGNGFMADGRTPAALGPGLGSVVTYRDGTTAIGAWGAGVPGGRPVASVRQNLHLLVDGGTLNPTALSCPLSCWGSTIGNVIVTARSGLGITARGELVWAAGEHLTPAMLGRALITAGAIRAVQLDINPFWVAGYLYEHRPSGPLNFPVVPGQNGIAGQLRTPDTRDFFTVAAR